MIIWFECESCKNTYNAGFQGDKMLFSFVCPCGKRYKMDFSIEDQKEKKK